MNRLCGGQSNRSCFGPLGAQARPIKRYNILVPQIFARQNIGVMDGLNNTVLSNIKKLQEYCVNNPKKIPKVSRRLKRLCSQFLKSEALGKIKVNIHTFIVLLNKCSADQSILFSKEITNNLVQDLLLYRKIEVQILGAELLSQFMNLQSDSEYRSFIESSVKQVCLNIREIKGSDLTSLDFEARTTFLRCLQNYVRFLSRNQCPLEQDTERMMFEALFNNLCCSQRGKIGKQAVLDYNVIGGSQEIKDSSQTDYSQIQHIDNPIQKTSFDLLITINQAVLIQRDLNKEIFRLLDQDNRWVQWGDLPYQIFKILSEHTSDLFSYTIPDTLIKHTAQSKLDSKSKTVMLKIFVERAIQENSEKLSMPYGSLLQTCLRDLAPFVQFKENRVQNQENNKDSGQQLFQLVEYIIYELSIRVGQKENLLEYIHYALDGAKRLESEQQTFNSLYGVQQAAKAMLFLIQNKAQQAWTTDFPINSVIQIMSYKDNSSLTKALANDQLYKLLEIRLKCGGYRQDNKLYEHMLSAWFFLAMDLENQAITYSSISRCISVFVQQCNQESLLQLARMGRAIQYKVLQDLAQFLENKGEAIPFVYCNKCAQLLLSNSLALFLYHVTHIEQAQEAQIKFDNSQTKKACSLIKQDDNGILEHLESQYRQGQNEEAHNLISSLLNDKHFMTQDDQQYSPWKYVIKRLYLASHGNSQLPDNGSWINYEPRALPQQIQRSSSISKMERPTTLDTKNNSQADRIVTQPDLFFPMMQWIENGNNPYQIETAQNGNHQTNNDAQIPQNQGEVKDEQQEQQDDIQDSLMSPDDLFTGALDQAQNEQEQPQPQVQDNALKILQQEGKFNYQQINPKNLVSYGPGGYSMKVAPLNLRSTSSVSDDTQA